VEAMTLADRIVVLNKGRIEQVGTPLELYHRPANLFVAGFIGSPQMNFIEAEAAGAGPDGVQVRLPNGIMLTVPVSPELVQAGEPVVLGVRPDHLQEREDGAFRGRIELVEQLGENHLLYVSANGLRLTARGAGDARHRIGDAVALGVSGESCHLFRPAGQAFARPMPADGATQREPGRFI
jgi:multiple sugar transport system ATP-binding protein